MKCCNFDSMFVWNGILFISIYNYEEWSCQQVYTIHSLKLPSKNASTGLFFQELTKKREKNRRIITKPLKIGQSLPFSLGLTFLQPLFFHFAYIAPFCISEAIALPFPLLCPPFIAEKTTAVAFFAPVTFSWSCSS